MSAPKVFVSSTCYDLGMIRAELRDFIQEHGFDPQMSDYSDILFDPRLHTHQSCLQEISSADILVLIVGSRFGGLAVPEALESLDFDTLRAASKSQELLKDKSKISITQLELLRAVEIGLPTFTFVDAGVMNDHHTYERNKEKPILGQIEFPNIQKQDTARYIFEFINFVRQRSDNNAIVTFAKLEDIKSHLLKQWAGLFQRLLYEQRFKRSEARRIDYLSNQLADIKAAIVAAIGSAELKETAKGAIHFRRMLEFVFALDRGLVDVRKLLLADSDWNAVLSALGIGEVKREHGGWGRPVLLTEDGGHYRVRMPSRQVEEMRTSWEEFRRLKPSLKEAIVSAAPDMVDARFPVARYHSEAFEEQQPTEVTEEKPDEEG